MMRFLLLLALAFPFIITAQLDDEEHPMVGGYTAANRRDPMVQEAATFAVKALSGEPPSPGGVDPPPIPYTTFTVTDPKLVKVGILAAQTQVVAGLNIRLTIAIREIEKPHTCLGAFDVDIYNHFGELSITQWGAEHSCDEANTMRKNYKKMKKMNKRKKNKADAAADIEASTAEDEEFEAEDNA